MFSTVLYKGEPLTGKTHCVGTWTAAGPLLYILWDPKQETISRFPDVHIIAPKTPQQFRDVVLPRIREGQLTDAKGARLEYATVAMDSLSFFARELELELMAGSDEMPDGAWNPFANRLAQTLSTLGSLARRPQDHPHPANFIATVHEVDRYRQVSDGGGRKVQVHDGTLPMISGRIRNILEGYFDLTLLTCAEEGLAPPDPKNPTAPRQMVVTHYCRSVRQDKGQAAGGSFGGLAVLPPKLDGTYTGLCTLAGVDPRTRKPIVTEGVAGGTNK